MEEIHISRQELGQVQGSLKALEDRVTRHENMVQRELSAMRVLMDKLNDNIVALRDAHERRLGASNSLAVLDHWMRLLFGAVAGGIATWIAIGRHGG